MSRLSFPLTRLLGLGVLCLGVALGCDGGTDPLPPPTTKPLPDATLSRVEVSRAAQVLADGEDRVTITVTVKQKDGSPLEGRTVNVEVSGDGNTVTQPTGKTDAQGQATASVVSTGAGAKTVTVSVEADGGAVVLGMRPVIDFAAPRATRLAFTATALSATAGAPIGGLEVSLRDARGRTVTTATDEVTLSLAAGPGDATLEGTLKANAVAGVVRFTEVVLTKAGTGYQLKVEAAGLEGATSATFAVGAAAPASLEVSGLPAVATAGAAQSAQVTVRDTFGNVATGYTGTLAVTSSDATAELPAAHAFTSADAGRFTFTGLILKRAGAQQVTVQDGATAALTSRSDVGVVAGAAAALVFTEVPTRASVRAVLSTVQVVLQDAHGNRAAVGAPLVTMALAQGTGLAGVIEAAPVDGVASFTNLRVNGEGAARLLASADALSSATSASIDIEDDVAPAAPSLAAGASTPTSATVTWTAVGDDGLEGTATSQELRYAESPITTDAEFAAASLVSGVGAPAAAGTAESATLTGLLPSRTYHVALRVTDNQGHSARSTSLPVATQDPAVSRLAFTVQPPDAVAGAALAEFTVSLLDANGDIVPTATAPVTLSLVGHPEFEAVNAVPVNGVATFTGVVVETAGTHRFLASANSLTVESDLFTIQADEAVRLALTGLVSPVTAGMTGSLVVTAYDRFDNVATGYTRTVHFTSDDAQAQLPGDYAFTAADAGRHVFSNVVLATSGPRRVTVTELMVTPLSDSLDVEVVSDAADRLVLSGLAEDVTAGALNRLTLSARDRFGNLVTGYTGTVRFTSDDAQAQLPGDYTFTAQDAGQHEFPVTLRSSGPHSVTATDLDTARAASAGTRVAAEVASRMALALSTTTPVAGQSVEATVTLFDAFDNRASGYRGTVGFQVPDDAQATVPGNHTFTEADAGQHTFSVTFAAVRNSLLIATETVAPGLSDDQQVTVSPGLLTELRAARQPGPVVAGQGNIFVVTAHDRFGNLKTDYTGTVETTTTDANPGVLESHTFTEANRGEYPLQVVHRTAGPQTVTFTDAAAGVSTTSDVTVEAAEPVRIVYVSVPATGTVRQSLAPVQVALRDAFGNTPQVGVPTVTVLLASGPQGTTLGGTLTVNPVNGVAVFPDLTVDQEGRFILVARTEDPRISQVDSELNISDDQAPAPAPAFTATLVDNDTVRLTWRATGDDGSDGLAASYELRQSPELIDAGNFGSAMQLPTGQPQPAGTQEEATVDLPPAQATWYFGLRVRDGAGNASTLVVTSIEVPGPCGGFVCPPRAPECGPDNLSLVTYAGACVVQGGEPRCEYTPSSALCEGQDAVCFEGACDTAPAPAPGELVISEVMHTPSAGTTEYLELTSTVDGLRNITNLLVSYDSGATVEAFAVQAPGDRPTPVRGRGTFVVANNVDEATNGGVPAQYSYAGGSFILGGSGHLTLEMATTVLDDLVYTPSFPQTVGRSMNLSSVVVGSSAHQRSWYWCDSSEALAGGDRGTPGRTNETCAVAINPPVDYCAIQFPKTIAAPIQMDAPQTIYSRFYDDQITNRNQTGNDGFPFIEAELGYGTDANAPAGWTWVPAPFNPTYSVPGGLNDDETVGTLRIGTAGSYLYGFRYRFTRGPAGAQDWVYCDQNGVVSGGSPQYGTVTVAAPPPPAITGVTFEVVARGAELVLTGTGFTGATSVTIGGMAQTFTVNSATSLAVASLHDSTPVGTAQPIIVTGPTGSSAGRNVVVIDLVISELDSDTAENPEVMEFVEISTGVPGVNLSGYSLVFFNGSSDQSYYAINLNAATDALGRMTVAGAGISPRSFSFPISTFLQNGPDAVALYQAAPMAPNTAPTANRLIDALVYNNAAGSADAGLLDALLWLAPDARRVQLNEAAGGTAPTRSIQRCGTGRRDGRVFQTATPTPGTPNHCP
ncbi:Ig-like domain-containing protein [Pyxidicoccus trucidator]|uniref:Ig-like domain-containing protein n=1 Tax=Pyxidicoccus trucidator TaxID=2709662 RepID=UPI0013DA0996|nr:Ig-like domain-containing protein [Pyxidicoccus trucidator]